MTNTYEVPDCPKCGIRPDSYESLQAHWIDEHEDEVSQTERTHRVYQYLVYQALQEIVEAGEQTGINGDPVVPNLEGFVPFPISTARDAALDLVDRGIVSSKMTINWDTRAQSRSFRIVSDKIDQQEKIA